MKILYVTGMWKGLEDVIYNGETSKGMPAFIRPLKQLIKEENEIDLIVGSKIIKPLNIEERWIKKNQIELVEFSSDKNKILNTIKFLLKLRSKIIKNNYDFIYCHGSLGALGNILANYYKIPCGGRIYGTFLSEKLTESNLKIFLQHPYEYLMFILKKKFLIVTNDGTKGDKVKKKLVGNKEKYKFHFLYNGVAKGKKELVNYAEEKILFYPARIASWKRQDLALLLLEKIIESDNKYKLLFAGHISDKEYYKKLRYYIEENNLDDKVEFLGSISKKEMDYYYKISKAILSFYDVSNLGNVMIEALTKGKLVISRDDGSLTEVVEHMKTGLLINDFKDPNEINKIISLLNDKKSIENIKNNAYKTSNDFFKTVEERVELEVKIINECSCK